MVSMERRKEGENVLGHIQKEPLDEDQTGDMMGREEEDPVLSDDPQPAPSWARSLACDFMESSPSPRVGGVRLRSGRL